MSEKNGYLPSRGREEFEEEFEHILFAKLEDEINRLGSGDLEQLIKETNKRIEIRLEQAKQKGGVVEHNALQNEKLAREVIDLTRQLVVSNAEERKQLIEKLARENVFLFPDAEDENGRVFSCETKMGILVHFIRNVRIIQPYQIWYAFISEIHQCRVEAGVCLKDTLLSSSLNVWSPVKTLNKDE